MRSNWLENVSRIVVKLGTGVLTNAAKHPDDAQMKQLVAQMAAQALGAPYSLVDVMSCDTARPSAPCSLVGVGRDSSRSDSRRMK